ncbi:DUF5367 family protein [Deinococcus oregonensis]|uniref:DUF5367 family protein n=1 Tax=Deinococcus oregonensis TaxID=1805970 RepID=A0ABV6AV39_9DEIO
MDKTVPLPVLRLFVLGLVFWVIAMLIFRLFGQVLLVPGDTFRTVLLFAAVFPLMYVLMNAVLSAQRLAGKDRVVGATWLLAPGLLLDGLVSVPFFGLVFPNMAVSAASLFGALMCAGYATGFLVSLLPSWKRLQQAAPRTTRLS